VRVRTLRRRKGEINETERKIGKINSIICPFILSLTCNTQKTTAIEEGSCLCPHVFEPSKLLLLPRYF
jgi:hypothetical protein